jgi:hypothetical protein
MAALRSATVLRHAAAETPGNVRARREMQLIMPKIIKSKDCGNSPRNLLVQSLAIAIERANASAFARCVTDDVIWALPGRRSFAGKAACLAYLKSRRQDAPKLVTVRRALSHGRAGAADGTLTDESGLTHGFCHVINFSTVKGDRISAISSYYSDLGDEQ